MATNPMQRKARSSFILGMFVTLLITGAIIVFLFLQIKKDHDEKKQELINSASVWVLNQDVTSGQIITSNMLQQKTLSKNTIPSNAVDNKYLDAYSLTDKSGHEIITESSNGNVKLKIELDGGITRDLEEESTQLENGTKNYFYYTDDSKRNKQYIELAQTPVIAKINMKMNSVVTIDMIKKSDEDISKDVRLQEYNMVALPTQLEKGQYVDIRLTLPNGQDFVVVSKKEVKDITEDTIWLNMTEEETVVMSNAIIEHYIMTGSKIYATAYIEAGMQESLIPTYTPSGEVRELLNLEKDNGNANLENNIYADGEYYNQRINRINEVLQQYSETRQENVEKGITDEITRIKRRILYISKCCSRKCTNKQLNNQYRGRMTLPTVQTNKQSM